MGSVGKDNVFELIINEGDPILARFEYLVWFFESYEGQYIDDAANKIREGMMYYKLAFELETLVEE